MKKRVIRRATGTQGKNAVGQLALVLISCLLNAPGQDTPRSAARPWHSNSEARFAGTIKNQHASEYAIDPSHNYTLVELVDVAETHNPDTRVAWQNAKARAEIVGVTRSELYPTIAAIAIARTVRQNDVYAGGFYRDTLGIFQPVLNFNYLIFDFGGRTGEIRAARADLFAADFAFNDIHRKIIYQVTADYYHLLNAMGQEEAATATLSNAQAVEKDAHSRLDNGLATSPDLLEAQAAAAQADFDLQAAIGALETAHGDLATTLGLSPETNFVVEGIETLSVPDSLTDTAELAVERGLAERPDLLEQVARVRSAEALIQREHSTYFPSLSFSGNGGMQRDWGQRNLVDSGYAQREAWDAELNLKWTLFDGSRRQHVIAAANAQRNAAEAQVESLRNQISDEIWRAYSETKTALRQRRAAAALMTSADRSYSAALKSYDLGVRNLLDVVSAQRALAQARSADISARTQVLLQLSNLAFRTGDLLQTSASGGGHQQ